MSLDPLLHASPVIQIHAAFAVLALIIGAIQLSRTKGDWLHRIMGRTWVAFMAVVSLPLAKGSAGHERHDFSAGF